MGTAFYWFLWTASLVSMATLIVLLNLLARKEYTEEIDRLRRDLLATRERNGVYIDFENYQNMTRGIEVQKQEIAEKILLIKALEREKELKEALCAELHISLKETEEELQDSKQMLKEAAETVELQLEKQNALAEQTRKILSVTEESTNDAYKLHDKLDRKRSVEENNFQATHTFQMNFRRNIDSMEKSVNVFAGSSTAFLLKLKEHLEHSVQKQNYEVTSLSQIFEGLLDKITNILQEHSKKYSNEVSSTEQLIQELLTSSREISENKITSLHSFMAEVFMPMCQNMQQLLVQHRSDNEAFHQLINTQIQNQVESALAFSTVNKESWVKLRKMLDHYVQQSQHLLEKAEKVSLNSVTTKKKFDDELQSKLDEMKLLIHSMEQLKKDETASNSQLDLEMSDTLKLIQRNNDGIHHEISSLISSGEVAEYDFSYNQEKLVQTCLNSVGEFTTKQSTFLNSIEHVRSQLQTTVVDAVSSEKSSWSHHSSFTEKQIRKILENLRHIYQIQQEQAQIIENSCQDSSEIHLDQLDRQRANYASFIREQLNLLESQDALLKGWEHEFLSYLHERNLDLEKFLSEDICRDIATGNTPQRREFAYPSSITMSSPTFLLEKIRRLNEAAEYKKEIRSSSQILSDPSTVSIGDEVEKGITESSPPASDIASSLENISAEKMETDEQNIFQVDNILTDKENVNVAYEKSITSSVSKEGDKRTPRKPLSSYN